MASFRSVFMLAVLVSLAAGLPARAQSAPVGGGLAVFPTRVVFEGRDRSAELNLVNHGAETSSYRISFQELEMTDTGDFKELPANANPASAAAMVRYSPRQVTLRPGEVQTVRLMLRLPANLPAGEYRSHLLFQAIPPVLAPGASNDTRAFSVQLSAVFGVAVPVIIRMGDTHAQSRITDIALQHSTTNEGTDVTFQLNRTGNRSVFGDLTVGWIGPDGHEQLLAQAKGVAVYVPNALRKVRMTLAAHALRGGKLHVRYSEPSGPTLAEAVQPLG